MADDVNSPPDDGTVFDDTGDQQPADEQVTDIQDVVDMFAGDDVEIELVEDDGLPLGSSDVEVWGGFLDESATDTVTQLQTELSQLKEMYLRKLAEFDNFRKRTEREREEIRSIANENLVRDLVPVLDNFDRALQHAGQADTASLRVGVEMIYRQFRELLQRRGVTEVDPSGGTFNPEVHEAVQRVEDPRHPVGKVVNVIAKGYLLSGRLIRPALVAVAVDAPKNGAQGAVADGGEGDSVP